MGEKMRRAIVKITATKNFEKLPGAVLTAGEYNALHPPPGPGDYDVKDARDITYNGGVPFQGKNIKRELTEVDPVFKAQLKTPGPTQYNPRELQKGGSYVFSQQSRDVEYRKVYHGPGTGIMAVDSPGPGTYSAGNWSSFKGVNPNGPPNSFGATGHDIDYSTVSPGPLQYNPEHKAGYSPKFGFGASQRGENDKTFGGEQFMSKGKMGPQLLKPASTFGPQSIYKQPSFTFGGHRTKRKMPKRYGDTKEPDEGKEGAAEDSDAAVGKRPTTSGGKSPGRGGPRRAARPSTAGPTDAASRRKAKQKSLAKNKDYSWLHYDGAASSRGGRGAARGKGTADEDMELSGTEFKKKQLRRPPSVHFGSAPRFNGKEYIAHKPDVGRLYTDGPGPAYAPKSDMGSGPNVPFSTQQKLAPSAAELSTRENPGPGQYQLLLEHQLEEERLLQMVADGVAQAEAEAEEAARAAVAEQRSELDLGDVVEVGEYEHSDDEEKSDAGGTPKREGTGHSKEDAAKRPRHSPVKRPRAGPSAGGGAHAAASLRRDATAPQTSPIKRSASRGPSAPTTPTSKRRDTLQSRKSMGYRDRPSPHGSSMRRSGTMRRGTSRGSMRGTPKKPMTRTETVGKLLKAQSGVGNSPGHGSGGSTARSGGGIKRVKTIGQLLAMEAAVERAEKMEKFKEDVERAKAERAAKLAGGAPGSGASAASFGGTSKGAHAVDNMEPAVAVKRGPPGPLVSRREIVEQREPHYFPDTKNGDSSKFNGMLPRTPSIRFADADRGVEFFKRYHGPGAGIMAQHSPGPGIYSVGESSIKKVNPHGKGTFGATGHERDYDTAGPGPAGTKGHDVSFPKKYSPAFGFGVSHRGEDQATFAGEEFMSKGKLGPGMYRQHADLDKMIKGGVLSTSRRPLGEIPSHVASLPGPGAYNPPSSFGKPT